MIPDPLMLSDTAMVLLRRQAELREYERAFVPELPEMEEPMPLQVLEDAYADWSNTHHIFTLLPEIRDELLTDIYLLWLLPDLVPQRSLDWHLVLNEALMALAEAAFNPSHRRLDGARDFIDKLESVYEETCATRKKNRS